MPEPIPTSFAVIKLTRGLTAIVDIEDEDQVRQHAWKAKISNHCWYAVRTVVKNGQEFSIKMHRQIAQTPRGMVCHHQNKHTLDNRKSNLFNVSKDEHRWWHKCGTKPERFHN